MTIRQEASVFHYTGDALAEVLEGVALDLTTGRRGLPSDVTVTHDESGRWYVVLHYYLGPFEKD